MTISDGKCEALEILCDFKNLKNHENQEEDESLLFTDGCVDDEHKTGGYGFHAITNPNYIANIDKRMDRKKGRGNHQRAQLHIDLM